jgi:predicted nucleic-acid-binding protein
MPVFQFEAPDILQGWIASARESKVDLSDLLVAHSAIQLGCESLITFDRRAARSEFFEVLK